jgi:hypothetical protein
MRFCEKQKALRAGNWDLFGPVDLEKGKYQNRSDGQELRKSPGKSYNFTDVPYLPSQIE